MYLLMLMKIDDDQVFKICIEFFHFYINRYLEKKANPDYSKSNFIQNKQASLEGVHNEIFLDLMKIISMKMAKPEEVLIVIDEDGTPVR